MSVPDDERLNIPQYRPVDESQHQSNLVAIERAFNDHDHVENKWHYVGDTADPISPAFNSNWQNFGSNWANVRFRKEGDLVRIEGLAAQILAAGSDTVFILPVGYRPIPNSFQPSMTQIGPFACSGNTGADAYVRVMITTAGAVNQDTAVVGTGGHLALFITFSTT